MITKDNTPGEVAASMSRVAEAIRVKKARIFLAAGRALLPIMLSFLLFHLPCRLRPWQRDISEIGVRFLAEGDSVAFNLAQFNSMAEVDGYSRTSLYVLDGNHLPSRCGVSKHN